MQQTAHHHSSHAPARFAHPLRNIGALGIEVGMKVADFGAGSGAYSLAIAERLAGAGHVYAIDVQQDLLRRIHTEAHKRGLKNISIIWSDLEREGASKLADHSIDHVLVSNILFQLADKTAPLREAWRILRPGGKLAIIDWADSFGGMGPVKQEVVKKESALAFGQGAGFELVREFEAGAHHYGLVFRPVPKTA